MKIQIHKYTNTAFDKVPCGIFLKRESFKDIKNYIQGRVFPVSGIFLRLPLGKTFDTSWNVPALPAYTQLGTREYLDRSEVMMGCGVALTGGGAEEISQEQSTLGRLAYLLVHSQFFLS